LLHSDNVESIIAKHLNINMSRAIPDGNLSLKGLITLTSNAKPETRSKLGKELFGYIFKNQISVNKLVSAFASGDLETFKQEYIKANYALYQKDSGFTGVMLMNFALGELQYYRNPDDMIQQIYDPGVYLISKDKAAQARQIISQVTLRPFKEPPVVIPDLPQKVAGKRGPNQAAITQLFTNYATAWARKNGIAVDQAGIDGITHIVMQGKMNGLQNKSIEAQLKKMIPALRTPPVTQATPPVRERRPGSPERQRRT